MHDKKSFHQGGEEEKEEKEKVMLIFDILADLFGHFSE